MKWLLSFGGKPSRHVRMPMIRDWDAEVERLFQSALPYGFQARAYNPEMIQATRFYEDHKEALDKPHMGWLFKPFIVHRTMTMMSEGDYLLYSDSNQILIADPQPLFDVCDRYGIFCHRHAFNEYPNRDWTKRDTFVLMDCDTEGFWNEPQTQVNLFALQKSPETEAFALSWLELACDPQIMDADLPSLTPNLPGFQEHRLEQSIFSLLRQKQGIPLRPDPRNIYREYYEGAPA